MWASVAVEVALVDVIDLEAEGPGDLVEEPGVGEEPLPSGALACGTAVVGGVQETVEGCLGRCGRGSIGPVEPEQDGLFGQRRRPGLVADRTMTSLSLRPILSSVRPVAWSYGYRM